MHDTRPFLIPSDFPKVFRKSVEIVQVNLGYLCNLSCVHCHVNASPKRTELMSMDNIEQVIEFIRKEKIQTLDLTGGAPEMNPHFRFLVEQVRSIGVKVIDRCNLVILEEDGYHDLAEFLAQHQVEIVASLPCYLEENVDAQRGKGTFSSSISALKQLNQLGYGRQDTDLRLNLVFNPQGPTLPPEQKTLETAYKDFLKQNYDIVFNQLFTITNLPIKRFGSQLIGNGQIYSYLQLLKDNFKTENLEHIMCRNTISIDWQGYVYDCDFNQMLDFPLNIPQSDRLHLSKLNSATLTQHQILTGQHCYACTAGQGSSCSGAL